MPWLLIGYMFLFIHRPFEVWPWLGDLQVERVYMICTMAFFPFAPGKRWLPDWQHVAHIGFAFAVLVCWVLSPWADYGQRQVEDYFKVVVFFAMLVTVANDEKTLKFLVVAFLVVMFVYMSHSLMEYARGRHVYRMGIPRLIGVDKTLGDANSFGNGLVYALPIASAVWLGTTSPWLRRFCVGYLALSTVCIGLTGSRGSFMGLIVWAAFMVLRSKYRVRLGVLMLMLSPLLFFMLPDSLQNRFTTIIDPSVGPANAQQSAEGRLQGFYTGMNVYSKYPLTGVGPGSWKPGARQKHESHCLYGQVAGEMGTIGIVAFVGVVGGVIFNAYRTRKLCAARPEPNDFLYHLVGGIVLAFVLMLLEGVGSHNLFRFNWLWYGGFVIIAHHCAAQRGRTALRPFRVPVLRLPAFHRPGPMPAAG
jgi:O-antigen ligase